jgi:probable phosphoglycerate mutase
MTSDVVPLFERPFYYLRHGESEANRLKIIAGSLDVDLNDAGREQARAAIALLRPLGITHIASSGMRRARETAAIVATALDLPHAIVPGLAERSWGDLEGKPRAVRKSGAQPVGAETPEQFASRTRAALAQVESRGVPLVVAHSGTFRVLCRLFGLEEPEQPVGNCRPVRFAPPARRGDAWTMESG